MEQYYLVTLDGMPEGDERARLEATFRAAINRQFGSDKAAAGALYASTDTAADEPHEGLQWRDVYAVVCDEVLVPEGACFRCAVNWPVFAGRT